MLTFLASSQQILLDGIKRLFRQACRRRHFRQPEVELPGQIQLVIFLKEENLVDLGTRSNEIVLAYGLLRTQQVEVREDLGRQLEHRWAGLDKEDGDQHAQDRGYQRDSPVSILAGAVLVWG